MYLKIFAILVASGLILSHAGLAFAEEKNSNLKSINITYLVKSGLEKYYVQFKACIGNTIVAEPAFTIQSDTEKKQLKFAKTMMPNTCKTFEAITKAKHKESVEIRW